MRKLLPFFALLGAFAVPALAHADLFDYSVSGAGGGFSGSGTLSTTQVGAGEYLIEGITGTGVTGLYDPNGFNGNDNFLFPTSTQTLDSSGFSFTDVNGPDHFNVNIFDNGTGYFAYLQDEDNFTETIPVTFTLSEATPEPSTFLLLGTGVLGFAGLARRKVSQA